MIFRARYVTLGICTETSRELLPFPIPLLSLVYLWINHHVVQLLLMAHAKSVLYHQLVSWNIKGEGPAQQRKDTVSSYLAAQPADILFLQEVQWVPTKLRSHHLKGLGGHYDLAHYAQEYANCYNCVIFDSKKFEAATAEPLDDCFKQLDKENEWEKKGFRSSQEKLIRSRMCVVILQDRGMSNSKFIAASLHNMKNKDSLKMAELFCKLLALLGDKTGYPIILAGDFNANIHKSPEVDQLGFTIPDYKPTSHRLSHRSPIGVTIDFFLFRPSRYGSTVFSLVNIKAEVARDDVIDSKGDVDVKKMDELHKVSNHDPLRAVLQVTGDALMQRPVKTTSLDTKSASAIKQTRKVGASATSRPISDQSTITKDLLPRPASSRSVAQPIPVTHPSSSTKTRPPPITKPTVKTSSTQSVTKQAATVKRTTSSRPIAQPPPVTKPAVKTSTQSVTPQTATARKTTSSAKTSPSTSSTVKKTTTKGGLYKA